MSLNAAPTLLLIRKYFATAVVKSYKPSSCIGQSAPYSSQTSRKRLLSSNMFRAFFQRSLQNIEPLMLASSRSPSSILSLQNNRCVHSGPQQENENQAQLNKRLPPLDPKDPGIIWPKFTNSIRNWFFTYFVIKPYFDKDFSVHEFMEAAHEAVAHVACSMANGEFDQLEGLVEPSLLSELKQRISNFSVSQQDLIRVATEDIFFSFPYQIGIIIPDSQEDPAKYIESGQTPPPQIRHVEITVVLHVLRGMAEVQRTTKDSSTFSVIDFTKDEENKFRVMVCNFRFFRDFTQGAKDPSWIINWINQFLPAEVQRN